MQLSPCPFCGDTDVRVACHEWDKGGADYYVFCHACQCESPRIENDRDAAITAWNRRVATRDRGKP